MFGSDVLEVVIGLVLIYFIMSVVCSAINEWIARIFAMRKKTLEAGIGRLLSDSDDETLKKQIYDHPLVKGLSRKGWWERELDKQPDRVAKVPLLKKMPFPRSSLGPSNLSARRFALVLFDTLMEAGGRPSINKGAAVPDDNARSKDVDDKGKSKVLQLGAREVVESLDRGIEGLAAGDEVKRVLRTLLVSAEAQVDQWDSAVTAFRVSIERWFDDAMDRVSGWYKRKAQLIILGLAVVICLALNVDTFVIANGLYRDTTLRASIVAAAEARAQQPIPEETESELDVSELKGELSELGLPIGWSAQDGDPRSVPSNFVGWVAKLLGVLFTALAVALGAPFWFDLLNRLVNLRSSGKQPAKASDVVPGGSAASSRT